MSARTKTYKITAVSATVLIASAFMHMKPSPAWAGKKTDKVLLGVAAGAAGLALLHALNKKKKQNPPVIVGAPPPPSVRPRPSPPRGYYPRPRPPVHVAPRPRAQYSAQTHGIQQALNKIGYNVGITDGLMGRATRTGVRQFQASLGQPITGYLTGPQHSLLLQRANAMAVNPVGYPGAGAPGVPGYNPAPGYPATGYSAAGVPGYRPPSATGYPAAGVPGYTLPVATGYPATGVRPPVTTGYPPAATGYPAGSTPETYRPPAPGYPVPGTPGYTTPGRF